MRIGVRRRRPARRSVRLRGGLLPPTHDRVLDAGCDAALKTRWRRGDETTVVREPWRVLGAGRLQNDLGAGESQDVRFFEVSKPQSVRSHAGGCIRRRAVRPFRGRGPPRAPRRPRGHALSGDGPRRRVGARARARVAAASRGRSLSDRFDRPRRPAATRRLCVAPEPLGPTGGGPGDPLGKPAPRPRAARSMATR